MKTPYTKQSIVCEVCSETFLGGNTAKRCQTCTTIRLSTRKNDPERIESHLGYCSDCTDKKFSVNPIKKTYYKVFNYLGICRDCGEKTFIWKLEDIKNTSMKDIYAVHNE